LNGVVGKKGELPFSHERGGPGESYLPKRQATHREKGSLFMK